MLLKESVDFGKLQSNVDSKERQNSRGHAELIKEHEFVIHVVVQNIAVKCFL